MRKFNIMSQRTNHICLYCSKPITFLFTNKIFYSTQKTQNKCLHPAQHTLCQKMRLTNKTLFNPCIFIVTFPQSLFIGRFFSLMNLIFQIPKPCLIPNIIQIGLKLRSQKKFHHQDESNSFITLTFR